MNNKEDLFSITAVLGNTYSNNCGNLNFGTEINRCLFQMYCYLLTEDQVEKEKRYTDFVESYDSLDKRGKEIIENEWLEITESKKEKIKRKGDR